MSSPMPTPKVTLDCAPLKNLIREISDFPIPGILFYDITTLLKDKVGFATLIDALSERFVDRKIDLVLGMEARGFIFAPALAYRLNAGFVPVRKPGKLPAPTTKVEYALEYGTNTLEVHRDAIQEGQRVIIVDDLLATGGTAAATVTLAKSLGAEIAGLGFVVELDFLKGREKLAGVDVFSLLHYDK
jgi:adenine phosphoribosyltransferase